MESIEFAVSLYVLQKREESKDVLTHPYEWLHRCCTGMITEDEYIETIRSVQGELDKHFVSHASFETRYDTLHQLLDVHWQVMLKNVLYPQRLSRLSDVLVYLCFIGNSGETKFALQITAHIIFCLEYLIWNDKSEHRAVAVALMAALDKIYGTQQHLNRSNITERLQQLNRIVHLSSENPTLASHPVVQWASRILNEIVV